MALITEPPIPVVPHRTPSEPRRNYQGKLYFTDMGSSVHIDDLNLGTASPPRLAGSFFAIDALNPQCICRPSNFHEVRGEYVVACNGDVLLVALRRGAHPREALAHVYKVPEWTSKDLRNLRRVTELDGYSLFLRRGDAFALPAKEFPAIKGDYVYVVEHDWQPRKKYWMTVYDLQSGAAQHVPYPEEHKEEWLPYTWLCPRRPLLER